MKDLFIRFSIRGRNCIGRWYRKTYRISIFLNQIWKSNVVPNEDLRWDIFLASIFATQFHEIVHVKIDEWKIKGQPCNSKKCDDGVCYWCNFTQVMGEFFMLRDGVYELANQVEQERIVNFRYEY